MIRNVNFYRANEKWGMARRFVAAEKASTHTIAWQDDDFLIDEVFSAM